MARGRKKENIEVLEEMPTDQQKQLVETIEFNKALRIFKKENIARAKVMEDTEVVRLFAVRHIPSLLASKEDWKKVFEKF